MINNDTWIRYEITQENIRRYTQKLELIDNKKKCIDFINRLGKIYYPTPVNWIRYCTDSQLFITIRNQYYNKNDLIRACHNLNIFDFDTYKTLYHNDPKLPPPSYINEGFYYDVDEKFNLDKLLQSNDIPLDY